MLFLSDLHLNLFTERNSDGTGNLRLKGKEFWLRYGRRITNADMEAIANYLKINQHIIALDLCYNEIGDRGICILVKHYLKYENNLRELNLMSCNITWKGIAYFLHAIKTMVVKSLRVNGNLIGPKGGILLATYCKDNEYLEHLDIGDSNQTLASLAYFREIFENPDIKHNTLRVLDISRIIPYNWYHTYDKTHLAQTIGFILKTNTSLIELHLQKNELFGHNVEELLEGMRYNKTLKFLDLGYNRIGNHGIEVLSNYLKTRPSLLGLNIAGNGITDYGARALHFGLPFSKIRLLDISKNKINDSGMMDILYSIKKPYFLRYFFIYGNNIGPGSMKIIERMLLSGVLSEDRTDIKLFHVDNCRKLAFNPTDRYKHKYYHELDYGYPNPIKIIKNKIIEPKTRAKIDFLYYPRFPANEIENYKIAKDSIESQQIEKLSIEQVESMCFKPVILDENIDIFAINETENDDREFTSYSTSEQLVDDISESIISECIMPDKYESKETILDFNPALHLKQNESASNEIKNISHVEETG